MRKELWRGGHPLSTRRAQNKSERRAALPQIHEAAKEKGYA
jgi:hypothetical protein